MKLRNNFKNNYFFTEPPPSRPSRDHIRIEKDGQLFNTMEPPPLIRDQQPTPEQSQRIKRYGEDIGKKNHSGEQKNSSSKNGLGFHFWLHG